MSAFFPCSQLSSFPSFFFSCLVLYLCVYYRKLINDISLFIIFDIHVAGVDSFYYILQKASHIHRKDGSSARPKGTMLEKAITELERMVAECKFGKCCDDSAFR